MKASLDNLIYYVEDATTFQWDNFILQLEIAETYGQVPRVRREIGMGFSKYHHNVRIGEGAGAIHIGYKHNSSPENQDSYRLRFEVNPSKQLAVDIDKARQNAVDIFLKAFIRNAKRIKGVDIAFDIPIAKERLFVASKTGRERNILKGTVYYGERGQTGHLKVYDKKKELQKRQGIEIEEEHLTRIEFSLKLEDPLTFQLFSKRENIGINDLYQVSHMDTEGATGNVKAFIIAVSSGEMQIGELSRAAQVKTKKALADMGLLDLDHAYANAHSELLKVAKKFLSADTTQYQPKSLTIS